MAWPPSSSSASSSSSSPSASPSGVATPTFPPATSASPSSARPSTSSPPTRPTTRSLSSTLFGEPTVFVAYPDSNLFVLQSEWRLFESSYAGSISTLLGRGSLLIMNQGQLHKKLHSLTINASMISDHLLPDIDRLVRHNLEGSDGSRIHLQDETKKITFELTVKQLMRFDLGEWTERLRRETLLVIEGFFSLPIPFFFTFYGQALKVRCMGSLICISSAHTYEQRPRICFVLGVSQARTKVADMLRGIVQERSYRGEVVEEEDGKEDMLGMLMENEEELSEEHMVDFMLALLVAG